MTADLMRKTKKIIDERLEGFARQWGIKMRRKNKPIFVWKWGDDEVMSMSVYPDYVVVTDKEGLYCFNVTELNDKTISEVRWLTYHAIEKFVIDQYCKKYRSSWMLKGGDVVAVVFRFEGNSWLFQTVSASKRFNYILLQKNIEETPFKYFDTVARSVALLLFNLPTA